MSLLITLLPLLALVAAPVQAQRYCRNAYGRVYRCDNGGLAYGARIGIGVGVAVGVVVLLLLCGFWRRRNLKNQWAKHRPPTLPFVSNNNNNNNASSNPYANNPPPPSNTNWNDNSYGNNPPPPPQTYQPSSAGQYGQQPKETRGETEHEHGYEWQQAREAERLEREQANGAAPPGYDVAASQQNSGNAKGYAPPPGLPPS